MVNSGKVSLGNILMKKAKSLSGVLSMRPDFLKIQGRHFLKFLIFKKIKNFKIDGFSRQF